MNFPEQAAFVQMLSAVAGANPISISGIPLGLKNDVRDFHFTRLLGVNTFMFLLPQVCNAWEEVKSPVSR